MTLGDADSDAHSLFDTPGDTLAEVEAVTLGDKRGDAHARFEILADTLAEMEEKTLGDTRRVSPTTFTFASVSASVDQLVRLAPCVDYCFHLC